MNRAQKKEMFISTLVLTGKNQVTKTEITEICEKINIAHPYWFTNDEKNKISRGIYKVPSSGAVSTPVLAIEMTAQVLPMTKHVEKSENRIQNIQTDLDSTDLIPKPYRIMCPLVTLMMYLQL